MGFGWSRFGGQNARRAVWAVLGLVALTPVMGGVSAHAQPRPPVTDPDREALYARYPYLETAMARFQQAAESDKVVGMAVAVLEEGRPVLIFTSGETAAGTGEPITPSTVFRAASLTKTFTGTLAAMLEEEGRLDLGQAVPASVLTLKGSRQPSVLEVLSHQTGLPPNAYDNLIEAGRTGLHARGRLGEVDLMCSLGSCYTYQNVAFSAVEPVLEAATGERYQDLIESHIFAPYGFPNASIGVESLRRAPSWARPHSGWRRTHDRPGNPESPYDDLPSAAGINVSLMDLIKWAQVQLNEDTGLSQAVRTRLRTPYVDSLRETRRFSRRYRGRLSDSAYGLGWRIYHWGDHELIAHSGSLSGYGAQIVFEPATGFAFVGLWNSDTRYPWALWPTVMDLRTGDGPGDWLDQIEED